MRLALVVPGFSAAEDDWCIPALHHLARRLGADHELRVLALRHPTPARRYRFFGARVRSLGAGTAGGVARLAMLLRAVADLRRQHRRAPFDAVCGLWADEAGFVATWAGRRLGVRSLVAVMGGELVALPELGYGTWRGRTGRWLVRRSLRRAHVVTVGSAGLEAAVRRLRPTAAVVRAPLGVDTRLFTPSGAAAGLAGDPCLLHVASLTPVKDQEALLAAFARVAAGLPGAHLHVIGDGPLRGPLEDRARTLAVGDRVRWHGAVAHHELPGYYRAADLHLLTSRFESQSMTTLEAAACGVATVGTAVGILPDLGDAARTVPVSDPAALADAVLAALPTARKLGARARSRVLDGLDLEQCATRLAALAAGVSANVEWRHDGPPPTTPTDARVP